VIGDEMIDIDSYCVWGSRGRSAQRAFDKKLCDGRFRSSVQSRRRESWYVINWNETHYEIGRESVL
jgi:hypothetical protein